MELLDILSPIVSAIIAAFGAYSATKRIGDENAKKQAEAIARLETKVDLLSERVEKHNGVMERTFRLEAEVENLYHRYDELRNDLKIGGTD